MGKYNTIYIDTPWSMFTVDRLGLLPVRAWSRQDALLFLWARIPTLEQSLSLLHSWEFRFGKLLCWYNKNRVAGEYGGFVGEHLLIGLRGSVTHSCFPETDVFGWALDSALPHPRLMRKFVSEVSAHAFSKPLLLDVFGRHWQAKDPSYEEGKEWQFADGIY